jgi:hypothetical protein
MSMKITTSTTQRAKDYSFKAPSIVQTPLKESTVSKMGYSPEKTPLQMR